MASNLRSAPGIRRLFARRRNVSSITLRSIALIEAFKERGSIGGNAFLFALGFTLVVFPPVPFIVGLAI
jgi:hypothetical protein